MTMIIAPSNFFLIFCSLNIRYPKMMLTKVDNWNRAKAYPTFMCEKT